jgi:hypothetical protein
VSTIPITWTPLGPFPGRLFAAVHVVNAGSLKANLALDQLRTTGSIDTAAFAGDDDVVERLLPYHIWQIHDQDQDCRPKGKRRREQGEDAHEKDTTAFASQPRSYPTAYPS